MNRYWCFPAGETFLHKSPEGEPYQYTVTSSPIDVQAGDSAWYIEGDTVHVSRGPVAIDASHCVVIRGYAPANRSASLQGGTNLPYINGTSSETLIAPQRPGDPTAQLLFMPAHTSEQQHHIHSTTRVVRMLEGQCTVIIGTPGKHDSLPLKVGDTIVVSRMTPHHFVTDDDYFLCMPIHVWSSVPSESQHPMEFGTHTA
ncbi:MAG: cupin domain-containing protein [Gammaproteobacteria bacterium]|nr:MAG: cupin domain-containing protein [Gammaproteobacteria bacterium]